MTAVALAAPDPEDLPPTSVDSAPQEAVSAAPIVLPGLAYPDALGELAGEAQTTRPTTEASAPTGEPSGGSTTPPLAVRDPIPNGAPAEGKHGPDQGCGDAQGSFVGADSQQVVQGQGTHDAQSSAALADPLLYLAAVSLDDLERVRIAAENRLRELTRDDIDPDGVSRGFGLTEDNPQVRAQQSIVDGLSAMEHGAELTLKRRLRQHPLHGWIKGTVGVGEKQAARLLAAIGDPYWNTLHDRPRTVSELWAYSGYKVIPADQGKGGTRTAAVGGEQSDGDPGHSAADAPRSPAGVAVRRMKGQKANWSAIAKMRAYLIAESCIKQTRSPYRVLYDQRRAHTAVTHPDWTLGHSHNDALRVVAKRVLRDLWIAARDVHGEVQS